MTSEIQVIYNIHTKHEGSAEVKINQASQKCRYCTDFLSPNSLEKQSIWNTTVIESQHFIVVPTLGMLVPGWLLIITKEHYLNMSLVPDDFYPELEEIKKAVRLKLKEKFGSTVVFEHGPGRPGESSGCGIDHAHWHVVPLSFDLLPELETRFPCRRIANTLEIKRGLNNTNTYIFYENQIEEAYLFLANGLPCQFFRRLIAEKIGKSEHWDWHSESGLSNIISTLKQLQLSTNRVPHNPNIMEKFVH